MRKEGAGRGAAYKDLEKELVSWLKERGEKGLVTGKALLRLEAVKRSSESSFRASEEWLLGFGRRNNVSFRSRRYTQWPKVVLINRVPGFWTQMRYMCLSGMMRSQRGKYDLLMNMDESPLFRQINQQDKVCVYGEGDGLVEDADTGKHRFATMVGLYTYAMVSERCVPSRQMLVFRGAGKRIHPEEEEAHAKSGALTTFEPNGWLNDEEFDLWLRSVLQPAARGKKCLLVLDSYKKHL
eukprot:TRINITY_DN13469_c0_g1_i1.p1 TRINITY_DN13469_c0_g1~~TRINITY_DN13469_c0_g1_i1.p1  ORF type:complete len:239 (-),score=49.46 TRINITY_DN13469_c0_g1_i1:547-1263(-)